MHNLRGVSSANLMLALITGCLSACSANADNTMNVDETLTIDENLTPISNLTTNEPIAAGPSAPVPTHMYDFRDGEKYGYVAAVSEEDQKRGKAAGDVVLFVYRGRDGDTYKIDTVTASGRVEVDYECKRPCAAIKQYTYHGVSYIGFTPSSLIGAAFTDAFNGYLVPAPLPKLNRDPATYYRGNSDSSENNPASSNDALTPPQNDPVVTNDS